jgi:hypothetical protein
MGESWRAPYSTKQIVSLFVKIRTSNFFRRDVLMVVKGRKQREVKSVGEVDDDVATSASADLANMTPEAYKKAMENANPEDLQKAMKVGTYLILFC